MSVLFVRFYCNKGYVEIIEFFSIDGFFNWLIYECDKTAFL